MEIVAEFRIAEIVRLPLVLLWQTVRDQAGVTRRAFDSYFAGLEFGVGIRLGNVDEFHEPIALERLRSIWQGFRPPQGFCYVDAADVRKLGVGGSQRAA